MLASDSGQPYAGEWTKWPLGTCKSQYLDYDIVCDISVGGELCYFENCDAFFIISRVRVKMNLSVGWLFLLKIVGRYHAC